MFCGGQGTRLRQSPDSPPKPLARIGEQPMIWHIMRYYAHFGVREFVLCLGYGARAIQHWFLEQGARPDGPHLRLPREHGDWRLTLVDTGMNASIGERLLRVREFVEGDELILANYADTLTDADLQTAVRDFRRSGAVASLLAVEPVLTHHAVQIDDDGGISGIVSLRSAVPWQNGGYFIFRPQIFDALRPGEDLVPQALTRLTQSRQIVARRHAGFWRAIDTVRDQTEVDDLYWRGHRPWMVWENEVRARDGALSTVPL
ncbi:glucose-1-phosphate cytidylyltransferase [Kineosporia succinea]